MNERASSGDLPIRLVYTANVLVAGFVGFTSLFLPSWAATNVFSATASPEASLQIVGSLWLAIGVLSCCGLFFPKPFSAVLLLQLLYKGGWLVIVALPGLLSGENSALPMGIAVFFVLWVLILPFVIPFKYLFGS